MGVMKILVNPVKGGTKQMEDVYKFIQKDVDRVLSEIKGDINIVIFPLIGTTGCSAAIMMIERLLNTNLMVILLHEPKRALDIRSQLTSAINDQEFKVLKVHEALVKVAKRFPIFITRNEPDDNFDRNYFSGFISILASCAVHSSGTTDLVKILRRESISAIQYLVYERDLDVDTISKIQKEIASYRLAQTIELEAIFAAGLEKIPEVERTLICNKEGEKGVILSFGLYKIVDDFLKNVLEEASSVLADELMRSGKLHELDENTLERTLEKTELGRRLLLIRNTLNGGRVQKRMKAAEIKKESNEIKELISKIDRIVMREKKPDNSANE